MLCTCTEKVLTICLQLDKEAKRRAEVFSWRKKPPVHAGGLWREERIDAGLASKIKKFPSPLMPAKSDSVDSAKTCTGAQKMVQKSDVDDDSWEDAYPIKDNRSKSMRSARNGGGEWGRGEAMQRERQTESRQDTSRDDAHSDRAGDSRERYRVESEKGQGFGKEAAGHRQIQDTDEMHAERSMGHRHLHTDTKRGADAQKAAEQHMQATDVPDGHVHERGAAKEEPLSIVLGKKLRIQSCLRIENEATTETLKGGLTPTEESLIRNILSGDSICVKTKNGYEKSYLYLIPVLNKINEHEAGLQAIILLQNKQAALSIMDKALKLAENTDIRIIASCGGTNIYEDIVEIKEGLHVLVTTPGRFLDIISRYPVQFSEHCHLVLDEADILIHVEKYGILTRIFDSVDKKQVLIFSFKFNTSLRTFAEQKISKYKFYNLLYETPKIRHFYAIVETRHKFYCLKTILGKIRTGRLIIYCNSIRTVKTLSAKLGHSAAALHSGMSIQTKNSLTENLDSSVRYIACNDIYPSNCEFRDVRGVINLDSPSFPDQYFNRLVKIGKIEWVVTLLTESELGMKDEIEKRIASRVLPISDSSFKVFTTE